MTPRALDTRTSITEAVKSQLHANGYAGLSTRRVASEAGVPLRQLHYHFGSKRGMVLATLEQENERLLERQRSMYQEHISLSQRYDQACDFLEVDIASGYVRLLQEMVAAGWADDGIADAVREMLRGWADVLAEVAREAEEEFGSLGPFTSDEMSMLVVTAFLGAETLLLLGFGAQDAVIWSALRRIGDVIRQAEESSARLHAG